MEQAPLAVQPQAPDQGEGVQPGAALQSNTPGLDSSSTSVVTPSQSLSVPIVSQSSASA